jgi:hypothetical protein
MKTVGQKNLKLFGGQAFGIQGACDLDLCPSDLKINRDHLLTMINVNTKYHDCGSKESKVVGRTSFKKSRPL